MKTKLNTHLLSTLPRVLRMTHNEVADASGISIACWYRIVKKPDKITVQQLIGLANGLLVPVSRFFSSGKADLIGAREDYIVKSGYQECYYDSDAVHRRIGEGTATSWRDAAEAVGMHWTNVASSLLAVRRTPVIRLLTLCETFDFDVFEFLIDPNINRKKKNRKEASVPESKDARFRDDIDRLGRKIDDLNATVKELTDRYTALLDRHNKLENRLNDYVGLSNRVGMAADGEPEES